jgi:hypothetical protein
MKSFKNIFIFITLCIITSTYTKQIGVKSIPTQPQIKLTQIPSSAKVSPFAKASEDKTAGRPQPKLSQVTVKSFQSIVAEVKNAPTNSVWDNVQKILRQSFITNLINDATAKQLNRQQVETLLMIARDYHAQFTGNPNDIAILQNLEMQRNNVINQF